MRCIDDEVPFELPERWEWCRLYNIALFELGKTLDAAQNKGTFQPYLRSVNVRWNCIDLSDIKQMRFENSEVERYKLKKNDLLICEGGDVGRCCIWLNECDMYYQNALHRVRFYQNIIPKMYMYIMMYLSSTGKLDEICKGVTIKHLTTSTLKTIIFQLPPLTEQKRIVAKIDELFSSLDQIEKSLS